MADHSESSDFVPPPFSFALMGHLATGVVKAIAIALVLWGLGAVGLTASVPVGTVITTAVVVMVAIELASTGVERAFVLRHRHPDPGSVAMTLIVAVLPLPISLIVGMLLGPSTAWAMVVMAVIAVVYWAALVALERPWAQGDSQADIRRKYEETKSMTRDQLRPE